MAPPLPVNALSPYFPTVATNTVPSVLAYVQGLYSSEESKRLIECNNSEVASCLIYALKAYSQSIGRNYVAVYSAEALSLRQPYIELQVDTKTGLLKDGLNGEIFRFLSQNTSERLFILDLFKLSASEIVRFNSLFDPEPSLDGVPLPPGTKLLVIGPCSEHKDASVYSRFGRAVEHCPLDAGAFDDLKAFECVHSLDESQDIVDSASLSIEFYGDDNWEAVLLGTWGVQGDQFSFKKGVLVEHLESGKPLETLVLKNPPLNTPSFRRFFQDAMLRGFIEY